MITHCCLVADPLLRVIICHCLMYNAACLCVFCVYIYAHKLPIWTDRDATLLHVSGSDLLLKVSPMKEYSHTLLCVCMHVCAMAHAGKVPILLFVRQGVEEGATPIVCVWATLCHERGFPV